MPTTPQQATRREPSSQASLRASAQDRVASLILALVVLVALVVVVLFLMWLGRMALARNKTVQVDLIEELGGRGSPVMGAGLEMEEPGVEELPDLQQPQLTDMIAAVTETITTNQATLDELAAEFEMTGEGQGDGDRRAVGPGGDGDLNAVPRGERWEIRFSTLSLGDYARQLDHFGVELGAVGGGSRKVHYAARLSQAAPQIRTASGDEDDRLYMSWQSGTLQGFDKQLLAKADVATTGKIVLQFYPPATEQQLARLELAHAGERKLEEIQKTVFGVRPREGGFEFFIVEQRYRPVP